MSREERREEMRGHLARWSDSGMTQKAYCESNGLAMCVFQYWRRKLNEDEESYGFAELSPSVGLGSVTIEYPNGVKLTVPAGVSTDVIRFWLKVWDA